MQLKERGLVMREKYLEELTLSSVISIVLSLIVCLMLPGITSKKDMAVFFVMFWFVLVYCVWSVLAWMESKKP